MSNSNLSLGLKAILYIFIILEASIGLQFMFFHHLVEISFGAKTVDPEITRLFGAPLLMISVMFILGIRSDSLEVIRVLLKSYIVFTILVLIAVYMNYTIAPAQPLETHVSAGILNVVLFVLAIIGLKLSKKA